MMSGFSFSIRRNKEATPPGSPRIVVVDNANSPQSIFRVTKTKSAPTKQRVDTWISQFVTLVDSMPLPFGYRDKLVDAVLTERICLSEVDDTFLNSIGITQLGLRRKICTDLGNLHDMLVKNNDETYFADYPLLKKENNTNTHTPSISPRGIASIYATPRNSIDNSNSLFSQNNYPTLSVSNSGTTTIQNSSHNNNSSTSTTISNNNNNNGSGGSGGMVAATVNATAVHGMRSAVKEQREKVLEYDRKPLEDWNNGDVIRWLYINSFSIYIEHFVEHSIIGYDLMSMDDKLLKDLGVQALGHRKKILKLIKGLESRFLKNGI